MKITYQILVARYGDDNDPVEAFLDDPETTDEEIDSFMSTCETVVVEVSPDLRIIVGDELIKDQEVVENSTNFSVSS